MNLKIVWKTIGTRLDSVLLDCGYRVEVVACVGFCGRNTFHHTFFYLFYYTFKKLIIAKYNYLLTSNKVALFSPRQTRDILLPER